MRLTLKNIEFVKEHIGPNHNPLSVFTVSIKEGNKKELREYSLSTLPAICKKWMASRGFETWYPNTEFTTYIWIDR